MQENARQRRRKRKLILLILMTGMTSVILTVGTYAWFVGTSVARVNQFAVSVGAAEGLELSLNASTWYKAGDASQLTISKDAIEGAYTGNTNSWGVTYKTNAAGEYVTSSGTVATTKAQRVIISEDSLTPVSTAGQVDATTGRLKLYGKSSLTATGGGYRLISQMIDNSVEEQPGYIEFDLFIKNGSGTDYITAYNALDNEAIYLTPDSKAQVRLAGSETDKGLANSLRVAFVQVGRIKTQGSSATQAQAINCTSGGTGLCADVAAAIWEPNDTKHSAEVITYFNRVCKQRTGESAYSATACSAITNGTDTNTYVVTRNITSSDHIDIYDGLNNYNKTTDSSCVGCSEILKNIDTYTDTKKEVTGNDRTEIFSLAPNSITKVRVYIYLEGQDVDNFDVATQNKTITINFGFTKDKWDMKSTYGLS